jgi:hypothetical protein
MWEYKYVQVQSDGTYQDPDGSADWDVHITELGAQGWEFVAMQGGSAQTEEVVNMLFRRPRGQVPAEPQSEAQPEEERYNPLDF